MSISDVKEHFIEVGAGMRFYFDPAIFDRFVEVDAAREARPPMLPYTLGREREMLANFGRHVLDKLHRRAADVRSLRPVIYAEGVVDPIVEAVEADPPPLKWSALRYGFRAPEDGRYGEAA